MELRLLSNIQALWLVNRLMPCCQRLEKMPWHFLVQYLGAAIAGEVGQAGDVMELQTAMQ